MSRFLRRLVLAGSVAAATATTVAAAATLGGVSGPSLGSGESAVAACDADGFTVGYTTVAGNVTSVTVGGIAAACSGGALSLSVTNSGGVAIASGGPQGISGASATVAVTPPPAAEEPAAVEIAIAGP